MADLTVLAVSAVIAVPVMTASLLRVHAEGGRTLRKGVFLPSKRLL